MNKITNLHLEAIDKINTFSPYDTNRDCQIAKMNNEIANKCSNITEDISIKFAEYCQNQYFYSNVEKKWSTEFKIYNGELYTIKELFNKFIETL